MRLRFLDGASGCLPGRLIVWMVLTAGGVCAGWRWPEVKK
jgi:hypothetical protein